MAIGLWQVRHEGLVLTQESRLFTLDFAWLDFLFSTFLLVILLASGKTLIFKSAYYFGLFAYFMDYIVYYHIQQTRTVEYVYGDTPMRPFGNAAFFFWFDCMNGADIVIWSLIFLQHLFPNGYKESKLSFIDKIILFMIPVWFWILPPITQQLNGSLIDNRTILVTRPSQKTVYYILCILFMIYMKLRIKLANRDIMRVLFSGIVCGLIHHAPLYVFGMRGYTSPGAFVITLLSEWPPIMCGLFVITYNLCCYFPKKDAKVN